jgi:hypothetical protein
LATQRFGPLLLPVLVRLHIVLGGVLGMNGKMKVKQAAIMTKKVMSHLS